MKAAAQVGLFVIIAVLLFGAGMVVLGQSLLGPKKDVYYVVMPDAGGLAKGAHILMAGVQVGEITDISLNGPEQARLTIGIKPKTPLPLGTRALISGSLVGLGDTPLSLVQDAKYRGPAGNLDPGMTILGGKAGPLDAILPDGGNELYTQLNETLKAVRKLLEDNGMKKDVRGLLSATQKTLETSQGSLRAFERIANRGDALLAQNQNQIAAIVRTADRTLVSVANTAEAIERYAKGGKLQNGANGLLADAHAIAQESKALLVDLRKTLNDEGLNANLRAAASSLTKTSEKLPGLVDNANKVAANVADLTAKSQELPGKLGTALDNAADLEQRLGSLVDKFGGVLGGKPKSLPPITTEISLLRETDPGYWRTDLNLTVPLSDGFVTAGLWDAFGRNRVNLQLGKNATPSLDYRYGIYAGRPAVGVDYKFALRLGLRTDLWDINDPRFDARLRYEFGGGLIGWLGMDKIFRDPSLTIGIGVRR